jgi:hypothetical protein
MAGLFAAGRVDDAVDASEEARTLGELYFNHPARPPGAGDD